MPGEPGGLTGMDQRGEGGLVGWETEQMRREEGGVQRDGKSGTQKKNPLRMR